VPPTLKDIATHCETSVSTVSHVLNEREGTFIGETTRARVLRAARELGYRPNQLARGLRSRRSMTVGVLMADLGYETHVRKLSAILRAGANLGFATAVSLARGGRDAAREEIGRFLAARVEGVIVGSFSFAIDSGDLDEARELGVPVVAIDPPNGGVAAVRVDRVEAGRLAAGHLLELGRRNLVFVGGAPESYHIEAERHSGFRKAHDEKGMVCPDDKFVRWSFESPREVAERLLARGEKPDGVVALSDEVAFALLQVFSDLGVRVPDDIAVVGYNDIRLARHAVPPLTTVAQPDAEVGEAAVRMLGEAIDRHRDGADEAAAEEVVLVPKLVVRSSCGGGA